MVLHPFSAQVQRYIKHFVVYLVTIGMLIGLTTVVGVMPAIASSDITVYRDPDCTCCGGWMDHLTNQHFNPKNVPTSDMDTLKQQYGIPDNLTSCHTAIIDGYIIEGHVPAEDIQRLLAERPDIKGIAVPHMPIGTPGMESGDEREPFTVFSFDQNGTQAVFSEHSF